MRGGSAVKINACLNARGLSYLEPVVMISQAMAGKADSYRMIVDAVNVIENDGEWTLDITK